MSSVYTISRLSNCRREKSPGLEALCRWPQRNDTFSPPETFITQAETSGFIVQLGDWVLRTAVEQVGEWQKQFKRRLDELRSTFRAGNFCITISSSRSKTL